MTDRRAKKKVFVVFAAALVLAAGPAGATRAAPRPPTVAGPRETSSSRPVFTFHSRGAASFRCSFDSTVLHRCARKFSQRLDPGPHVLRVRAVDKRRRQSKVVTVRVNVLLPGVPGLLLGSPIAVGRGAGVPAVGVGAAWVPTTGDGMLARVDAASGAVTARVRVGPATSGPGDLDSAVFADGAVWSASDSGGTIARVDPSTNAVVTRLTVVSRPGGLAAGGGFVWAFHFLQPTVTRIDVATNAVQTFDVAGLSGTGIAYGDGSVWVLSARPARIFRLDPATGALRPTIALQIPFPPVRSVVETWWLSFGDGAVWATLPNNGGVVRVDAATGAARYVRISYGDPFGIVIEDRSAWVATDRALWRLDDRTGTAQAASLIPRAGGFGFVSVAAGGGKVWLTTYDRGTVVRVDNP
jgi:streptogramin lyase